MSDPVLDTPTIETKLCRHPLGSMAYDQKYGNWLCLKCGQLILTNLLSPKKKKEDE